MTSSLQKVAGARPLVVILEDDHGVRRSLQLLLQGRGFNVKAYANARALLDDPFAEAAACLVADYCLGDTDGIAVLKSLRARGWDQPAILMTAFGSAGLAERARAAGFSEIVEKPLKERGLTTLLERLTACSEGLERTGSHLV